MTESATHEHQHEPLLPGAHRVIRVLALGEGPFQGVLVANGDDLAISSDAASLIGWQGWNLAGAEHIATPIDLVRRRDGQDVLLPWCRERVGGFIARRHGVSEPLAPGEISTLVISLLRGLREAGAIDSPLTGEWWLTSTARPVFALGGGPTIESAAIVILETLRAQSRDRALLRVLGGIADGLSDVRRAVHSFERWESELLEHAAPRPLRTGGYATQSAGDLAVGGGREKHDQGTESALFDVDVEHPHKGFSAQFAPLLRWVRDAWATVELGRSRKVMRHQKAVAKSQKTQDATAGTRRWARPMLVGGVAAAAVIVIGVLWPTDGNEHGGDAARAESSLADTGLLGDVAAEEPLAEATAIPSPVVTAAVTEQMKPLDAVAELVSQTIACAEGNLDECESAWYPIRNSEESSVIRGVENGTPALIEDYGDLAAVRWESNEGAAAQMLVLIRIDERWRIQDVYDVADPPSQ